MRPRINKCAICSSANYRASKRVHRDYIYSEHEKNRDEVERICSNTTPLTIEERISLGRRPYTKCFGKVVYLTASEAKKLQGTVPIYWA